MNPLCPLCLEFPETIEHMFFFCPWVRGVWLGSSLSMRVEDDARKPFEVWLWDILCHDADLSSKDATHIAWILWLIWKERNDYEFNQKVPNPFTIIIKAKSASSEYLQVNDSSLMENTTVEDTPPVVWTPPPKEGSRLIVTDPFSQRTNLLLLASLAEIQGANFCGASVKAYKRAQLSLLSC